MANLTKLPFNPKSPTILHIDLNSCFATIEQQANPLLRGKPIAVAAYTTPSGCILAPSMEAKTFGVKTGMRVKDGLMLCPEMQILSPEPIKYRNIHMKLRTLLNTYTDNLTPKSIDEFVLNLEGCPSYKRGMLTVGQEIKDKIRKEIGDWLTVSVGVAPNRFLAKTAAGLHKPDGLDEININNFKSVYNQLELRDLTGIDRGFAIRLNNGGIFTVNDFYLASDQNLRSAFQSILGHLWYVRLRGWEVDDVEFGRKSYGNSYAIPNQVVTLEEVSPILSKLVHKTGERLRRGEYRAKGVHVSLVYKDHGFWHAGVSLREPIFASSDIYRYAYHILATSPYKKPVGQLAVSVYNLEKSDQSQLYLFEDLLKKESLVKAVDRINERWGKYVITPATMMGMDNQVIDRVPFGAVKEFEEFILS